MEANQPAKPSATEPELVAAGVLAWKKAGRLLAWALLSALPLIAFIGVVLFDLPLSRNGADLLFAVSIPAGVFAVGLIMFAWRGIKDASEAVLAAIARPPLLRWAVGSLLLVVGVGISGLYAIAIVMAPSPDLEPRILGGALAMFLTGWGLVSLRRKKKGVDSQTSGIKEPVT